MSPLRWRAAGAFRALNRRLGHWPLVRSSQPSPFLRSRFAQPACPQNVLQSRFPTKTVLFLLGLGGAAYYFVDWEHDITHELNPAALHFHKTPEDCKMAMAIRPQPLMNHDEVNEYLDMCIATMDEEDSKKYNIPVTHAFHLPSNSPTVSNLCFLFETLLPSVVQTVQNWKALQIDY